MSFLSFVKGLSSAEPAAAGGPRRSPPKGGSAARSSAKVFSAEQVAQHATESDCYTVVEGKVYDVTKYLRLHPGGFKLLFKNAGGDSTADFLALRHSAKSRLILEQYYVGELAVSHASHLSVHTNQAAMLPQRRVGAQVGPQPFLSVAPNPTDSAITRGPPGSSTPSAGSSSGLHRYPPPRPNALHSSTSHPDRLTAYTSFSNAESIPLAQSSNFSISLQPPSSSPSVAVASSSSDASLGRLLRSPTTEALEQHLASGTLSPISGVSESESDSASITPPPKQRQTSAPAMTADRSAVTATSSAASGPSKIRSALPAVPLFSAAPVAISAVAAVDSADAAMSDVIAPPSFSAASPPLASAFGPRLFTLTRRIQRTEHVQMLSFEPFFPPSAVRATLPSTASAASSHSAAAVSTIVPSALDPALWLRLPPGSHISLGCTLPSGEYIKRPYTPISNRQGCFELIVKRYKDGVVSSHLHALPLHSQIEVFGPFGSFDFDRCILTHRAARWLMLAQGTGVAPMFQLIKHLAESRSNSERMLDGEGDSQLPEVLLIQCDRSESEILLREELERGGSFQWKHVLSSVSGRLNQQILSNALLPSPGAVIPSSTLCLLCGSDDFLRSCTDLLRIVQPDATLFSF